jgi:hypothetical protein
VGSVVYEPILGTSAPEFLSELIRTCMLDSPVESNLKKTIYQPRYDHISGFNALNNTPGAVLWFPVTAVTLFPYKRINPLHGLRRFKARACLLLKYGLLASK